MPSSQKTPEGATPPQQVLKRKTHKKGFEIKIWSWKEKTKTPKNCPGFEIKSGGAAEPWRPGPEPGSIPGFNDGNDGNDGRYFYGNGNDEWYQVFQ